VNGVSGGVRTLEDNFASRYVKTANTPANIDRSVSRLAQSGNEFCGATEQFDRPMWGLL